LAEAVLAIALGSVLGALLRWGLANALNGLWPVLPPGTLLANLVGGYLIGLALAWFAHHPALPPAWRLFAVTGFLGALTTFSTFSAEVVHNLMAGRVGWALATVASHVVGSVAMTLLGIGTVALIRPPAG
jgi:CrcB protein